MGKSIMVLIILVLALSNCDKPKYIEEKPKKEKVQKIVVIEGVEWHTSTGSDGHDYLDNHLNASFNSMHYIDCELCKRRNDTLKLLKL